MKPDTARANRRLLSRRKQSRRRDAGGTSAPSLDGDFDPVEFAEFMDAEGGTVPVDPAFEERLREQLWRMVRERAERNRHPRSRRPTPRH